MKVEKLHAEEGLRRMAVENNSGGGSRYQLTLINRELFQAGGIIEVESFDEHEVVTVSKLGPLIIRGDALHITQLNLQEGQLVLQGDISSILYADGKKGKMKAKGKGVMERLFK